MTPDTSAPLWPRSPLWEPIRIGTLTSETHTRAWHHKRRHLRVISSLVPLMWFGSLEPHWVVSVSRSMGRQKLVTRLATDTDVQRVVRAFGIPDGWEEDNHQPGRARVLFCLVDPEQRKLCECKTNETQVVTRGKTWSNEIDPSKCRGCEFEALTRSAYGLLSSAIVPCPIHGV